MPKISKALCYSFSAANVNLCVVYRVLFIENVRVLDMRVMQEILAKEVQDFERGEAPVLAVCRMMMQREDLIRRVEEQSGRLQQAVTEDETNTQLGEIETSLRELRTASIRMVELIVLWRDAFRYLAMLGTKQRSIRKKRAQTAI